MDKVVLNVASRPAGEAARLAAVELAEKETAALYLGRHVQVSGQDSADEPRPAREKLRRWKLDSGKPVSRLRRAGRQGCARSHLLSWPPRRPWTLI